MAFQPNNRFIRRKILSPSFRLRSWSMGDLLKGATEVVAEPPQLSQHLLLEALGALQQSTKCQAVSLAVKICHRFHVVNWLVRVKLFKDIRSP